MKKKSFFSSVLKQIAHTQTHHPIATLLFIIALTALFSIPAGDVRVVASLEQMMPRSTPEIATFNQLRDADMGRDAIAIIMRVNEESSIETTHIDTVEHHTYFAELAEELRKETSITEIQYGEVNSDNTEMLLIAFTDAAADDSRMKRLAQHTETLIEDMGHPKGVELVLTGTPIIQQKLGEYIQSDQETTRLASTIAVFAITALLFGLTSAIIPILTVVLSVNWLYGTMGLLDLPISTLAGGVAAMVIGIGIDFAIHLMNKFKYERKTGLSIAQAIEEAVVHTGGALAATAATTTTAFLAFSVGIMPEMGRFGVLMALGISYALILTLIGLPAMLVLEEKIIAKISKKAHFGIEGEYSLKKNKK